MAIDLLENFPDSPHSYLHDLESVFYVMCWVCTLYSGPCSKIRQFSNSVLPYVKTAVANWNGDTVGSENLDTIFQLKMVNVSILSFQRTLSDFASYFDALKDCMWSLRDLLFAPEAGRPGSLLVLEKKKQKLERKRAGTRRRLFLVPVLAPGTEVVRCTGLGCR